MGRFELGTSLFENDPLNSEAYIIHSDQEAQAIVADAKAVAEIGAFPFGDQTTRDAAIQLFEIAERVSEVRSFSDNQTYPRPSHPYEYLRKSPYYTFAGILISLRCTLNTEMKVTRMLMDAAPDEESLLSLTSEEVAMIIKPSGFADRKAGWIVGGLRELANNETMSIDTLSRDNLDVARAKVLTLPGFGPKAADCFLLAGLNRASFPVDVNVFNLVVRMFPNIIGAQAPNFSNPRQVMSVKSFLEQTIPGDVKLYQIMHTYLLLATKHRVE